MKSTQLDPSASAHLGYLKPEVRAVLDKLRQHQGKLFPCFATYADASACIAGCDSAIMALGTPDHRDTAAINDLAQHKTRREAAVSAIAGADKQILDSCSDTWALMDQASALAKKVLTVAADALRNEVAATMSPHFPEASAAKAIAGQAPAVKNAFARIEEVTNLSELVGSRFGNEPANISHEKIKDALFKIEVILAEAERAQPDLARFLA